MLTKVNALRHGKSMFLNELWVENRELAFGSQLWKCRFSPGVWQNIRLGSLC